MPRLTVVKVFDAVGEPETLTQRWKRWKQEFKLYVVSSEVTDATQKNVLLLHMAGLHVQNMFNNSIPTEDKEAKNYKKAMDGITTYFKP